MIPKSLYARLLILGVIVLSITGTFLLYGATLYGHAAADRAYDQLLRGAALQFAERVTLHDARPVVDIPPSAFSLLALAENDHVFYKVATADGTLLAGYPDLQTETQRGKFAFSDGTFKGFELRFVSYGRAIIEEGYSGEVEIIIAQTKEARRAFAGALTKRALLVLIFIGLLVLTILSISVYWAMSPLRRLEDELLARAPLDFSPLQVEVPQEMETFTSSMNRFLRRLKRRTDTMQRLIADSTHQIRTPIAALRAQAEMPIDLNNPEEVRKNRARISAQAASLSRFTEQLLSQTLIHHRTDTVIVDEVDLRKVAMDAERALRTSKLWPDDAIELDLDEEPCLVMGDAFSLREAVKNLISNALEYGKPPVRVKVRASEISIIDQGQGFDFNPSPALARNPQKNGLGLSIVMEVMQLHEGQLQFEKTPAEFCARLTFEKEGA